MQSTYRRLALLFQPDKAGSTSTFQELQHAYQILSILLSARCTLRNCAPYPHHATACLQDLTVTLDLNGCVGRALEWDGLRQTVQVAPNHLVSVKPNNVRVASLASSWAQASRPQSSTSARASQGHSRASASSTTGTT